jgi:hypothetical protein
MLAGLAAQQTVGNTVESAELNLTDGLEVEGAVTFNDSGADVDFRIEADDTTHMFFIDAGNDRIGINQSTPTHRLHIVGADENILKLEETGGKSLVLDGNSSSASHELYSIADTQIFMKTGGKFAARFSVLNGNGNYGGMFVGGDGVTAPITMLDVGGSFSTGLNTLATATTCTPAIHAGCTNLLGEVGGNASLTVTLPAATGTGHKYKFVVSVVNTSNYVIQVVGDDIMQGHIVTDSTSDAAAAEVINWKTAADSDTMTFNATTTGGVQIGDWIELTDIASNTWMVYGYTTTSGTEATPFSAAVS